jgi:hypothetical protein
LVAISKIYYLLYGFPSINTLEGLYARQAILKALRVLAGNPEQLKHLF